MVKRIGTHPSTFHLDDAAACFVVRTALPGFADATVIRTSDAAVLAGCDIVFDVGGSYDHSRLLYDHHQRGFAETFSEKWKMVKLSSFGLLYRHYGRDLIRALASPVVLSDSDTESLYNKFYDSFVVVADANDNGVSAYGPGAGEPLYTDPTTLASRVSQLNPPWNVESDDEDRVRRFLRAVDLAGSEITTRVKYLVESWLPGRNIVQGAYLGRREHDPKGRIVVMHQSCPWKDLLRELEAAQDPKEEEVLYVVSFDKGRSQWSATAVPKFAGSFENRLPFPAAWRGHRDADCARESQVPGAIFVHASGFLACNSTLEGMLEMCRRSIAMQS